MQELLDKWLSPVFDPPPAKHFEINGFRPAGLIEGCYFMTAYTTDDESFTYVRGYSGEQWDYAEGTHKDKERRVIVSPHEPGPPNTDLIADMEQTLFFINSVRRLPRQMTDPFDMSQDAAKLARSYIGEDTQDLLANMFMLPPEFLTRDTRLRGIVLTIPDNTEEQKIKLDKIGVTHLESHLIMMSDYDEPWFTLVTVCNVLDSQGRKDSLCLHDMKSDFQWNEQQQGFNAAWELFVSDPDRLREYTGWFAAEVVRQSLEEHTELDAKLTTHELSNYVTCFEQCIESRYPIPLDVYEKLFDYIRTTKMPVDSDSTSNARARATINRLQKMRRSARFG